MSGKLWGHFGNSYSEIILNILKNPFIIFSQIKEGAFFEINKSLGFINFASPTLGILSNLYGLILYMSNNLAKNNLWWYNSTFLIPGLLLSYTYGLTVVFNLYKDRFEKKISG